MKLPSLSMGIVTFLCLAILSSSLWAASPTKKKPDDWGSDQGDDIPLLGKEKEQALDEAQAGATNLLFSAAEWIDSFFDDERSLSEINTTRATIKLSLGYSKNDDFEVNPRFDLRLRLPKLSKRVQLIVQGSDDSDFDVDDNPNSTRPGSDKDRDDLTAALRFFIKESEKYNISYDLGVSLDYVYTGFRFRSLQEFGNWQGRFTDRLRYYTDEGWENRATYDLETQFHRNWLFRSTTAVDVYESEDGIPHSQKFRLYQVYSAHQAMAYETGFYFDTDPSYKMTDTQLILRYRQRFYRDWLVLEVSPRVTFPEDHDRDANPGIIFKFEAAIGYKADEAGFKKIFY